MTYNYFFVITAIAIVSLLSLSLLLSSCECHEISPKEILELCRKYAASRETAKAHSCVDTLVAFRYYELGKVLFEFGRTDEAILNLKRAVEIDSRDARSHALLAKSYLLLGENHIDVAIEHSEAARELAPHLFKDYIGCLEVANLYIYRKKPHLAIPWINLAIPLMAELENDTNNNNSSNHNKSDLFHHHIFAARAFEAGGKFEDAVRAAQNAVKKSPNLRVYAIYCKLLLRMHRVEECINFMSQTTGLKIVDVLENYYLKDQNNSYYSPYYNNKNYNNNNNNNNWEQELLIINLVDELKSELHRLQYPSSSADNKPSCLNVRALLVEFKDFEIGLGLQMNSLAALLSYGYRTNRMIIPLTRDEWPNIEWQSVHCPNRSFMCLFEPISGCSSEDVYHGSNSENFNHIEIMNSALDQSHHRLLRINLKDFYLFHSGVESLYLPRKYEQLGMLRWRSLLMSTIFRPTENAITSKAYAPCDIALHIRRGLKFTEEAPVAVDDYLEAIHFLSHEVYGRGNNNNNNNFVRYININGKDGDDDDDDDDVIVRVYLATDDEAVRSDVIQKAGQYGIQIINSHDHEMIDKKNRITFDAEAHVVAGARYGNATLETVLAINDILQLSQCSSYVGTFSSGFSRTSYFLMISRILNNHNNRTSIRIPPSISLDLMFHFVP